MQGAFIKACELGLKEVMTNVIVKAETDGSTFNINCTDVVYKYLLLLL